jgi:hypothetical protein
MTAPRQQEQGSSFARFDRVYDLYRDCILNQEYYGYRLSLFSRIAFWLEVTIVVGSGASGVAGWVIWTKYPASAALWGVIAAASTLLAALKPVLQTDTKLKRHSSLFSAYRQLAISMKVVVDEIAEFGDIARDVDREVGRVRARYRSLSVDDDPRPSSRLVAQLQAEVDRRVPASSLFYPSSDPGGAGAAQAVPTEVLGRSFVGDAEGMDVKVDPIRSWPHHKVGAP